ncbi:unnamed protein product [Angiostrongylus costaricensis]|uniref:CBM20 domain-containing protein n=1 Tax=Angiostrongylus costaricensis TaxID=334426 RepID=A0A0R3PBQ3_ANGCS|nr:unnamed protein product [Angiostrongylus costaricensis]
MLEKTRVEFIVTVQRLKIWEKMFVCGSDTSLGEWDPLNSFPLTRHSTNGDIWSGTAEIIDPTKELKFRYMVGYYLDPCIEGSEQLLIVNKELVSEIVIVMNYLMNDDCKKSLHSAGQCLLSDGWITHNEENIVLLRIHGEALKFYKPSQKGKEHRVKIVPFDVRFKEVLFNT